MALPHAVTVMGMLTYIFFPVQCRFITFITSHKNGLSIPQILEMRIEG